MTWITTKGEQFLDKHTEIGDSIGHVKKLQEDFSDFENKAKVIHHVTLVNLSGILQLLSGSLKNETFSWSKQALLVKDSSRLLTFTKELTCIH